MSFQDKGAKQQQNQENSRKIRENQVRDASKRMNKIGAVYISTLERTEYAEDRKAQHRFEENQHKMISINAASEHSDESVRSNFWFYCLLE